MTTFQDPPPQSRRAVRQSEGGDNPELATGFTQQPPVQAALSPQFYPDASSSSDMWDTTARRAAQLPPAAPREQETPAATGRRAAVSAQPSPVAEPLTYSTQSRQQAAPSNDGPTFRARGTAIPQRDAEALAPTEAMQQIDQTAYRVRDFSPEPRTAAPTWNPPVPAAAAPSDLEYHTEVRASVSPIVQQPIVQLPIELTLSRRELRAIEHAEEASILDAQARAALEQRASPAVQAPAPAEQPPAELSAFEALFQATTTQQPPVPAQQPLPPVAPEPLTNTALTNAIAEFDSLTSREPALAAPLAQEARQPAVQLEAVKHEPVQLESVQLESVQYVEPGIWTAPVGHWSTQATHGDEFPESTINRTIGSGSTATNALVLPSIPLGTDIRGPLTSTGEIMLTGSIDLPHNLSSTGASDRFDHDGLDALFDLNDSEVISTDSEPVRAIRAVSTHSSGHGVTHTKKPKGNRALVALLISASSMAVVVAGLLVVAFALNLF